MIDWEAVKFTADYFEHATLRDGTKVVLRLTMPEDRDLLRRAFDKWSPESRYARFLVPKQRLTDEELTYLCDVDQINHFAIGALREDGDGQGEPVGMGIARFIRLPDVPGQPPTAEAAIAVADEAQGIGLGRLLFEKLAQAAAERGIEQFRCEVLASNTTMTQLIDRIAPVHHTGVASGVLTIDFPVPADASGPFYELFRAAAAATRTVAAPSTDPGDRNRST